MASKTRHRGHGAGGLYQRASDGMWCASITLPEREGKRRRKVIARADYAEAATALKNAQRDLMMTGDLPTASPTLATWIRSWLDRKVRSLKPRTAESYRHNVQDYIVPSIGKIRMEKLTVSHVYRMQEYVREGRSSTTALQAHRVLQSALSDAHREGVVTQNVAAIARKPQAAVATRGALSVDDARRLLLSVAADRVQAVHWSLALLAGLRQGERLGVTRDALDLDAGMLTVSWQVQRLKWQHGCGGQCGRKRGADCPDRHVPLPDGWEGEQVHGGLWMTRPKSRAGWREVPLVGALREILDRHVTVTKPGSHGLLLHRGDGQPVDPRDDSQAWHAALKAAGVPSMPLHSARHTTATLLHWLGVDDQTRMQIMGHSSATVTAGYTHVSTPQTVDAMTRLDELLKLEG